MKLLNVKSRIRVYARPIYKAETVKSRSKDESNASMETLEIRLCEVLIKNRIKQSKILSRQQKALIVCAYLCRVVRMYMNETAGSKTESLLVFCRICGVNLLNQRNFERG